MLITEKKLRSIIKKVLLEAEIRPAFDHKSSFNQWLHTVFQGVEDNFRPFTKAVYKSKSKQKKLEDRWQILKSSNSQNNISNKFYNFINEKVIANNNSFNKEMIGDFFMENNVNPYDLFYDLKFFIKPVKDFTKFSKRKIPSSSASSPDFKFYIDENQWEKYSKIPKENNSFSLNNLSNASVGDMTDFGKVVRVDRSHKDV
tara:strand:- start:1249 stop:1851 length:603 start_codon:yes stop_codon:yes gene_type:complete